MSVVMTWQHRAQACLPGLHLDGDVVHRTDKAVLLAGTHGDTAVVAKLLTVDHLFWRATFAAETDTYRAFAIAPPPVPVPRFLAADLDVGVLVLTRLPGAPVSRDRHPTVLPAADVRVMIDAALALRGWSAPDNVYATVWDYPHRFHRYRTHYRLLDERDEAALRALTAAAGPMRLAHGDLLPANVLRTSGGVLSGVLDWEFTGWFLPGLDAALLWLVLGQLPGARRYVEQIPGDGVAEQAGFWVNVATVCVRELRTHGELPAGRLRDARLPYLRATWDTVNARVHRLASTL